MGKDRLTLGKAQLKAREFGCTIKHNAEFGEYRVNVIGGSVATIYYTDNLTDALNTAEKMVIA